MRPAAISSIVFFDKKLVAPCMLLTASQNFPKSPAPEILRQIYPVKVPVTGIYAQKVPVQECKTAYVALLLPSIGRSLP